MWSASGRHSRRHWQAVCRLIQRVCRRMDLGEMPVTLWLKEEVQWYPVKHGEETRRLKWAAESVVFVWPDRRLTIGRLDAGGRWSVGGNVIPRGFRGGSQLEVPRVIPGSQGKPSSIHFFRIAIFSGGTRGPSGGIWVNLSSEVIRSRKRLLVELPGMMDLPFSPPAIS